MHLSLHRGDRALPYPADLQAPDRRKPSRASAFRQPSLPEAPLPRQASIRRTAFGDARSGEKGDPSLLIRGRGRSRRHPTAFQTGIARKHPLFAHTNDTRRCGKRLIREGSFPPPLAGFLHETKRQARRGSKRRGTRKRRRRRCFRDRAFMAPTPQAITKRRCAPDREARALEATRSPRGPSRRRRKAPAL